MRKLECRKGTSRLSRTFPPVATILADKELYQRRTEATDRQISALVHELYKLLEGEIAAVEVNKFQEANP